MRSAMNLPGDGSLDLRFRLPDQGLIQTRAEPRHETGNELGLAFEQLPGTSRAVIAEFVTGSLTQGF